MQQTLAIPPVDRLRRAFESVRSLTAADAPGLANDAYGILVKGLPLDEARVLKGALEAEGILTELVPEQLLPRMPATKFVRRVEFGPDALLIHDPLGRRVPVEYGHLLILAAGLVETTEFRAPPEPVVSVVPQFGRVARLRAELEEFGRSRSLQRREVRVQRRLVELILTGGVARFTIEVEANPQLLFQALGEERVDDPDRNLAAFMRRMQGAAPKVLLNRGAFELASEPSTHHAYPSRNAFQEELIWMLWQAAGRTRR